MPPVHREFIVDGNRKIDTAGRDQTADFTIVTAQDLTLYDELFVTGVSTFLGNMTVERITANVGVQASATTRTATADGLTTGTVAPGAEFVTVTSADANHIIVLPAPTPGTTVRLRNGATGYELRTTDPATVKINGGSGAAAESAIAANSLVTCVCDTATTWVCMNQTTAGVIAATEVAAP